MSRELEQDTRAIAFNRGYDAFAKGPLTEIPYKQGTSEYRFFLDGHAVAQYQAEEAVRELASILLAGEV